jgi:hypothetical protein
MKVCHMEAMKEVRLLEEKKEMLLERECERFRVSYKEGERKLENGYSYRGTRDDVAALDARIREIKSALAAANCTCRLEGFDVSIGEALVMLAQWNAEYARLAMLSAQQQISRRITPNGILEYTECLFDVEEVARERNALKQRIGALQIAIDRANLLSQIEI